MIDALAAAINARDLGALDAAFTDDIVMEWPQSGERIRGAKNRREIYSRFPSLPTVTPGRITEAETYGCSKRASITAMATRTSASSSFAFATGG